MVWHICRQYKGSFNIKKNYPVIAKNPKVILEKYSLSCPICSKLLRNAINLDNHLESLKKNDIYHRLFFADRFFFKDYYKQDSQTDISQIETCNKPKFGKINIKTQKKID
ncbi:MAG: hypothetical protein ACFE9C_13040 [Candidatus Hodarchaeota archaeon]